MKRMVMMAFAALLAAPVVHADGPMGGLGFRSLSGGGATPSIGVRHWLNERAGFDAGIGFLTASNESGTPLVTTDEATGFSFDVGVPISARRWEKVNVLVRPGFVYGTATTKVKALPTPPNEFKQTLVSVSGEIEVELMLAEKVSISAAHGVAYQRFKFKDNDSPANETRGSAFRTIGSNFTSLGFHVYLW